MPPPRNRSAATAVTLALLLVGLTQLPASATRPTTHSPAADLSKAQYTVSIGSVTPFDYPDDTPATPFIDQDGTFYYQESDSLYGASDPRQWSFYSGTDFDTATPDNALDNAVNPADPSDANNDTTARCDQSPTGLTATSAPSDSGYAQPNYCDLLGMWIDPDTGDWYGLVHNEFTPEPFGDGLHYDSIDYAVSTDHGKVWTIKGHAVTSPYSTTRGDTAAFPNQTYDYGDGDPRLYIDTASGYFYLYYSSRIEPKGGQAGSGVWLEHVARAPISAKMATSSWEKWYDGTWSQPGVGGLESNLEPVSAADPEGYTPVAEDYDPADAGTTDQMVAAGTLPAPTPLGFMNITYDAYLGLYIGEPAVTSASGPQLYYVTDDLATQKWYPAGDSGSYTSGSWYRWFLDSANATNSMIVGKTFRSYCAIDCASSDGEYADETVTSTVPAPAPVDPRRTYRISNGNGRVLAQVPAGNATTSVAAADGSGLQSWSFTPDGDGSYRITNAATGELLGVDSNSTADRAWGTAPTATRQAPGGPTVGQQWFIIPAVSASGAPEGTFRLVNRYSGLVIGMSSSGAGRAGTTPLRTWTDRSGGSVGGTPSAADQTLTLTANGTARGAVRLP